ncbi:MAG: aldo/keto reductase [Clostridiales bacterium]|nr:aldo/keto reductase [Clostridiales bacterium]
MNYVRLQNGVKMPQEGFGVFQIADAEQCEKVVMEALSAGYRLIDTAAAYMNEEAVGRAIKKSGIPREEIFVTTKLWIQDAGYENAKKAFQNSLDHLGLDYAGKIRAIGVCNFYPERLTDLCMNARIAPMVNQVECHPFFQQKAALENMKELGVQIEAWGPLAEGQKDIFHNPVLTEIGKKYGKTVAQVILRWHIQRGVVVILKSVHKNRIEENLDIWDFELTHEDMDVIGQMDLGHSEIIDHFSAATAKWLNSYKIHK